MRGIRALLLATLVIIGPGYSAEVSGVWIVGQKERKSAFCCSIIIRALFSDERDESR